MTSISHFNVALYSFLHNGLLLTAEHLKISGFYPSSHQLQFDLLIFQLTSLCLHVWLNFFCPVGSILSYCVTYVLTTVVRTSQLFEVPGKLVPGVFCWRGCFIFRGPRSLAPIKIQKNRSSLLIEKLYAGAYQSNDLLNSSLTIPVG